MKTLTPRQREILDYIEKHISVHKFPPSYRSLQKAFNFSSLGTVSNLIASLKRKGVLQKKGRLLPTKEIETMLAIPIIAKFTSGLPLSMLQEPRSMTLPTHMAHETSYLIEIEEEEGMIKGDLILVEPREAKDGELVMALIAKKHTLIRRYKSGEMIELIGEKESLRFRQEHIEIIGIVTNLLRSF